MNFLTIGIPFEAAVPMANSVIGAASVAARPLIGLGVFATLVVLFKPLIMGSIQRGIRFVAAKKSLEERRAKMRITDRIAIDRYARNIQNEHPSLANELRSIALRD